MPSVRARFIVVAVVVYVVDRLTKLWALDALADGQARSVVGSFLRLRLLHNSGAAFSVGSGSTWVFTLLSTVVCAGIVVAALTRLRNRWWALALGGLLGGALGNLTDRLLRPPGFGVGEVVDFIALPRFAVFNVADSAIVVACIGMFLLSARGVEYDKEQQHG